MATTQTVENGNDRSIESDRLSRALTESLTVRDAGKLQYLVGHEDAEYLVDVEAGTCECPDYRHRGKRFVCKHVLRASVHHAYRQTHNTRLVARALAALRDVGCPHDVAGCGGPTDEGQRGLPCEGCIAATPGHWVVYCRLSGHDEWLGIGADADRGEGVATDGGTVREALEDLEDATSGTTDAGTEPEPTNLHRDKRPEVHGYGPEVQRTADGSIRNIKITVKSGQYGGYQFALTYYVNDGTAHVEKMKNDGRNESVIGRRHLRMLALADDVVGRVPGVETVTRFEDEIAATRETYERDLDERCDEEGCYDMPDKALESGRCRTHTPEEERR